MRICMDMIKRRFSTSFLLLIVLSTILSFNTLGANNKKIPAKTGFDAPDFAYPKTVDSIASVKLVSAIEKQDWQQAIIAAIQIDIAQGLVSNDSFQTSVARFDSIAGLMPSPWRNIALILEANMYAQLYSQDSYQFNRRQLPPSPRPENVMEWSGRMFSDRVCELLDSALSNENELSAIPLADIKNLIENYKKIETSDFSVADFLSIRANAILRLFVARSSQETIPFGNPQAVSNENMPTLLLDSILENGVKRNRALGKTYCEAFFCNLKLSTLRNDDRDTLARQMMERFIDTPYCVPFIRTYFSNVSNDSAWLSNNDFRRKQYEILKDYVARFPDAMLIGDLESIINDLEAVNFQITVNSPLLPGKESTAELRLSNIKSSHLQIYEMPKEFALQNPTYSDIDRLGRLKVDIPVETGGIVPDIDSLKIALPPLPSGIYSVVLSKNASKQGIICNYPQNRVQGFTVSDIMVLKEENHGDGTCDIYVVSALNGKPVEGAETTVEVKKGRNGITNKKFSSDQKGLIKIPKEYLGYQEILISHGNNHAVLNVSYVYAYSESNEVIDGSILTDLSVYKPGDTVKFSAVAWQNANRQLSAMPNEELRIQLRDANYQEIDILTLKTDEFGRVNGEFVLPKSGLLGSWQLVMIKDNRQIAFQRVMVAEYKMPTFYVETERAQGGEANEGFAKFSGKALTFAGMPLANATVNYEVTFRPFFFFFNGDPNAKYARETKTDEKGYFEIELQTDALKGTPFEYGSFTLNVNVTDGAGETQGADPLRFTIRKTFAIRSYIPSMIEAGKQNKFKVAVVDALDKEVPDTLYFRIFKGEKIIKEGSFVSPEFHLDTDDLQSGEYSLEFSRTPDFETTETERTVKNETVIWRRTDTKPARESIVWVDDTEIKVEPGQKSVSLKVGSSFDDSYILAVVSNTKGQLSAEWLKVNDGFITFSVPAPVESERNFVEFIGFRDLNWMRKSVTLIPLEQTFSLQPEIVTFRDKIYPGAKESWKIRFTVDSVPQSTIPVMAVMTNKALNNIYPFNWFFNPSLSLSWPSPITVSAKGQRYSIISGKIAKDIKFRDIPGFRSPDFETYGYPLAGFRGSGRMMYAAVKKSEVSRSANRVRTQSSSFDDAVEEEDMVFEAAMDSAVATGAAMKEPAEEYSSANLRNMDMTQAFFLPALTTDDEGVSTIEFDAPNFIGTWQFQIMAYTPEMKGAVMKLDAVSAKKVMAQMNAPRFARTGDRLYVSANIFNNSGERTPVSGRMEFVNPLDNTVLKSEVFDGLETDDSSSRVIVSEITIPSDMEALQIRVYGSIPGFSDGEQTVIPILPSSAPVMESVPFYLEPSENEFVIKLPEFDADASVTFTYCDNPVWECVTALPDLLKPTSASVISNVYALFGNCVAKGLFDKYPQLLPAVRKMAEDSTLVSHLQQDEELKTVLLNNTPWVNNAKSETLRMQNLLKYEDSEYATVVIDEIVKTLQERQNNDGGWGWCPDMRSSLFITEGVFYILGSLNNLGYLPGEAKTCAKKASSYIERQLYDDWQKGGRKYLPVASMIDYMFAKDGFKEISSSGNFKQLETEMVKYLRSDWRELDIKQKATAALILADRGYSKEAVKILESVLQFASSSRDKGMWFDNLESNIYGSQGIYSTVRVLQALQRIEPENPVTDKFRQWLVVSKQTMDWGDNRFTADAINALLTTGTDWTGKSEAAEVELDGKAITLPDVDSFTGAFKVMLNAKEASGAKLTIRRSGAGPAWGGITAQFVAPIEDVKAAATPQLSIVKNIYSINSDGKGSQEVSLKANVGDKVRVTMMISCDRDLQYVAVTDPRPACLEPTQQLSSYTVSDGIWMYREVRDTATNLFIEFLPKGTHVISYECHVDREGEYALGPVTAQSQYAPAITAHSEGKMIQVR